MKRTFDVVIWETRKIQRRRTVRVTVDHADTTDHELLTIGVDIAHEKALAGNGLPGDWIIDCDECMDSGIVESTELVGSDEQTYIVYDYPADGSSDPGVQNVAGFASYHGALAEVRRRLGDIDEWRVWPGHEDENTGLTEVVAFHSSREPGCGGVHVSKKILDR